MFFHVGVKVMYDGGTSEFDVDYVATTTGRDKTFARERGAIERFFAQVKKKWRRYFTGFEVDTSNHETVALFRRRLKCALILHHLSSLAEKDMFRRKNKPEPNSILSIF